jgi:hypothetical protein
MTLAEWGCVLDGYYEEIEQRRRESAWSLSHLLAAAGCDADKVTPAKLLGEPEPRTRQVLSPEERKQRDVQKIFQRLERRQKGRNNAE